VVRLGAFIAFFLETFLMASTGNGPGRNVWMSDRGQ
jgi:hypothetical protein